MNRLSTLPPMGLPGLLLRLPPTLPRIRARGFSLLEVLVALTIMAFSLAALYQAAGGSVRGVQRADQRAEALILAQSILDAYSWVPAGGLHAQGTEADGLHWQIVSSPYPTPLGSNAAWPLYAIEVTVWRERENGGITLASLLPGRVGQLERSP